MVEDVEEEDEPAEEDVQAEEDDNMLNQHIQVQYLSNYCVCLNECMLSGK